jgi:hypothetical protein
LQHGVDEGQNALRNMQRCDNSHGAQAPRRQRVIMAKPNDDYDKSKRCN